MASSVGKIHLETRVPQPSKVRPVLDKQAVSLNHGERDAPGKYTSRRPCECEKSTSLLYVLSA